MIIKDLIEVARKIFLMLQDVELTDENSQPSEPVNADSHCYLKIFLVSNQRPYNKEPVSIVTCKIENHTRLEE
jgi:hypothetical protein